MKNFAAMRAPLIEVIRAYAHQAGLTLDWEDPLACISKLAWMTQTPKEFDFKSSHWPSQFHYTGPAHDGLGRIESDFPWDRLTGEPLIYASMGTLQNGLEPVFTKIAEAVGERFEALHLPFSYAQCRALCRDREQGLRLLLHAAEKPSRVIVRSYAAAKKSITPYIEHR